MRSGRVALGGWLVLAVGACGSPLVRGRRGAVRRRCPRIGCLAPPRRCWRWGARPGRRCGAPRRRRCGAPRRRQRARPTRRRWHDCPRDDRNDNLPAGRGGHARRLRHPDARRLVLGRAAAARELSERFPPRARVSCGRSAPRGRCCTGWSARTVRPPGRSSTWGRRRTSAPCRRPLTARSSSAPPPAM